MKSFSGDSSPLARSLRRRHVVAEDILWEEIRNRKLAGLKFARQYHAGRHILDFSCAEYKLAIELIGGIHTRTTQEIREAQRSADLRGFGLTVLEFRATDVQTKLDTVLQTIRNTTDRNSPISSYLHFNIIKKA